MQLRKPIIHHVNKKIQKNEELKLKNETLEMENTSDDLDDETQKAFQMEPC
jgi:hypothetical protein